MKSIFNSFNFSLVLPNSVALQSISDVCNQVPAYVLFYFILVQYPVLFRNASDFLSKMGCKCNVMLTLNSKNIAIQSQILSQVVAAVGVWKV